MYHKSSRSVFSLNVNVFSGQQDDKGEPVL